MRDSAKQPSTSAASSAPAAPSVSSAPAASSTPAAANTANRFALFAIAKRFATFTTFATATLIFAVLVLIGLATLSLTGCSTNTPTDNTGGISNTAEEEAANINLVNTSQLPDSSFIYDAQIADLANSDSYINGQTVQVTGEVVGDRITSDYSSDFYWITLQATDGSYAQISVYMPASSTKMIDTYGSYGKRGTILQVRGTFWIARTDHEGVTELEAQNVSVVKKGEVTAAEVEPMRFIVGAVLLVIGAGLALLYWYLGERRR